MRNRKVGIVGCIPVGLLALTSMCINLDEEVIPEPGPTVIARLEIHPPTFARTEETAAAWTGMLKVDVPVPLDSALSSGGTQGGTDDGHMHKSLAPLGPAHGGDPHGEEPADTAAAGSRAAAGAARGSVDTMIAGWHVSVRLDSGRMLYRYMNGMWMEMQPDSLATYVSVRPASADMSGSGNNASGTAIAHSTVVIKISRNSIVLDSATLLPAYGSKGLFYTGNVTLSDTGALSIKVDAAAPTDCGRDAANKDRLLAPWAAFFSYTNGGPSAAETAVGDTTFSDGVKMSLEAGAAKTLWIWNGSAPVKTPPVSGATHAVTVHLHDTKSLPAQRVIPYAEVHCTVLSDDGSQSSQETELAPIHGVDGLWYGANMGIPMMGGVSGADPAPIEGGSGDGHDHQH